MKKPLACFCFLVLMLTNILTAWLVKTVFVDTREINDVVSSMVKGVADFPQNILLTAGLISSVAKNEPTRLLSYSKESGQVHSNINFPCAEDAGFLLFLQ
jgi:hypothetical protein